jgi:hypothetical protein
MYSPSGQIRNDSPQVYAAHLSHNRVRREPAVGSSTRSQNNSDTRSNSGARTRAAEYAQTLN